MSLGTIGPPDSVAEPHWISQSGSIKGTGDTAAACDPLFAEFRTGASDISLCLARSGSWAGGRLELRFVITAARDGAHAR